MIEITGKTTAEALKYYREQLEYQVKEKGARVTVGDSRILTEEQLEYLNTNKSLPEFDDEQDKANIIQWKKENNKDLVELYSGDTSVDLSDKNHYLNKLKNGSRELNEFLGTSKYPLTGMGVQHTITSWSDEGGPDIFYDDIKDIWIPKVEYHLLRGMGSYISGIGYIDGKRSHTETTDNGLSYTLYAKSNPPSTAEDASK